MVGAVITGIYLDKTRSYKLTIQVLTIATTVFFFSGCFTITKLNVASGFIACFVLGFFSIPAMPATYPFTVMLCHPLPPAIINGLMMLGAQVYAFLMSILVTCLVSAVG